MNNIYAAIPGFDNRYFINIEGKIIDVNGKAKPDWTLSKSKDYISVCLKEPISGKHKDYMLHILVAKTFIPNPFQLPVVSHLDDNKRNPHRDNLKWDTQQGNMLNWVRTGTRPSKYNITPRLLELQSGEEIELLNVPGKSVSASIRQFKILKKNPRIYTRSAIANGYIVKRLS